MKPGFLVNFFSLNASSLINKLFSFGLFLLLVRYLSPAQYGTYTLVWAYINFLSPLNDFGTTTYGILHTNQTDKQLLDLTYLRVGLAVIIFALTNGVVFFLNSRQIFTYTFLLSFIFIANALSGSFLIITSLKQKVFLSSLASVIFNIIATIFLGFVLVVGKQLPLLFLSSFVAYNFYSIANILLISHFLKIPNPIIHIRELVPIWKNILKKSSIFVLIGLLGGLYFKLDIFLLSALKTQTDIGIYSAGYKFFEALLLISSSFGLAATPIYSQLKDSRSVLLKRVKRDSLFLLGISIVCIIGLFTIGQLVLPYLLKSNFTQSIEVLHIVIFALPFILVNTALLTVLYVYEKGWWVVWLLVGQSLLNFILNFSFIPHYSFWAASYITIISEVINTLVLVVLVRNILQSRV